MSEQPTLHTERLILRPFRLTDAAAIQELAGAHEIADTTVHIPHPYPDGAAEKWIGTLAPAWEAGKLGWFAITGRESESLMGAVGLVISPENVSAELGYWIATPHWKRGYCTEAAHAMVAFGFDVLRLNRIEARYFVRNHASGRVLQKLGMKLEGIHREAEKKWDRFEDLAVCAILASEWGAVLEERTYHTIEFSPGLEAAAFVAALSRVLASPSGISAQNAAEPVEVFALSSDGNHAVTLYLNDAARESAEAAFSLVPITGTCAAGARPREAVLVLDGLAPRAMGVDEAGRLLAAH